MFHGHQDRPERTDTGRLNGSRNTAKQQAQHQEYQYQWGDQVFQQQEFFLEANPLFLRHWRPEFRIEPRAGTHINHVQASQNQPRNH